MTLGYGFAAVTGALQIFRASRLTNLPPVTWAENATNERGGVGVDKKMTGARFANQGSGAEIVAASDITSILVYPSFAPALNPSRKTNLFLSSLLRKL